MITRSDLEQLRALIFEIRSLNIEMLKPEPSPVVDTVLDYRHDPKGRPLAVAGYDNGQQTYDRLEKQMAKKQREQMALVAEMEAWIEEVPDPEMRTILRLYYRDGLSQREIAKELGYEDSTISHKLKRFWMVQK